MEWQWVDGKVGDVKTETESVDKNCEGQHKMIEERGVVKGRWSFSYSQARF